jgi:hypothetical protein
VVFGLREKKDSLTGFPSPVQSSSRPRERAGQEHQHAAGDQQAAEERDIGEEERGHRVSSSLNSKVGKKLGATVVAGEKATTLYE